MSVKNMSPAQLATSIGVQRSGISHILSGRNKPSLDFIIKLLDAFTDLNESWLLKGQGEMLKTMAPPINHNQDLFESPVLPESPTLEEGIKTIPAEDGKDEQDLDLSQDKILPKETQEDSELDHGCSEDVKAEYKVLNNRSSREVIKWVAYYNDHSFEEFFKQ